MPLIFGCKIFLKNIPTKKATRKMRIAPCKIILYCEYFKKMPVAILKTPGEDRKTFNEIGRCRPFIYRY